MNCEVARTMAEREGERPYLSGQLMRAEDYRTAAEAVESEFEVLGWIPKPKVAEFRCAPCPDAKSRFDGLLEDLSGTGCVPFMSEEGGELVVRVGRGNEIKKGQRTFTKKHLLLFLATIATTLWVGSPMFGVNLLSSPLAIWRGWPYTAAIMGVLGVHESGHYLMSRVRNVIATPPYFIPVPFALGTFGAVIRVKSPMPDRKSMFDIGVAGPLLGLACAIPVTLVGLYLSPISIPEGAVPLKLGAPVIYRALSSLIPAGEGGLHPVAFAGWVGFFVTFLNLLPVGQLDGGHIFRALFGRAYRKISSAVPIFLLMVGFSLMFFLGVNGSIWIFWGFISLFFHGVGHPPPLDDVTPLGAKRRVVGYLVFALMLACFTPVPIQAA